MPMPSPLGRAFINQFQGGFPLCDRPFEEAALALGTDEATLITAVQGLLEAGILTRFGPLWDAERLGGRFTLAAMAVPEPDFEGVARLLEASTEVAHNYRRDHELNMWFVLATPTEQALQAALRRIQSVTGLSVYDFPKLKEYHLGFWLHLDEDGGIGLRRVERERPTGALVLDALDLALVEATQAGLPLDPQPYEVVALEVGSDAQTVQERLRRLLAAGAARRIGAVPNHYRLGLKGNGMTVWDIDEAQVDALGERIGALDCVSHCYRRPPHLPLWPYNLFAMVHGRDRAEVTAAATQIEALVGTHCRDHRVLFSEAILKKTGLRFAPARAA